MTRNDSDARVMASRMLAYRPLSANALFDKLLEKGVCESDAQSAVEYMIEMGAVNDAELAVQIMESLAARGYGEYRIKMELRNKGFDSEDIEAALEELGDPEEAIDDFVRAHLRGKTQNPDNLKKIGAALSRRGFAWQDIKNVLNRYY